MHSQCNLDTVMLSRFYDLYGKPFRNSYLWLPRGTYNILQTRKLKKRHQRLGIKSNRICNEIYEMNISLLLFHSKVFQEFLSHECTMIFCDGGDFTSNKRNTDQQESSSPVIYWHFIAFF